MKDVNSGTLLVRAFKILSCIAFMYTFSISLTFYNKWIMKKFHFPLSLSMFHYSIVFLLTALMRRVWEIRSSKKRTLLKWSVYLKRVAPTAVATAVDIGLSNWSFMFITVSLYTMCKTSAIIFILIFSLLFGLEKFHYSLFLIVFLIAGGLFMFTYESTQFNITGFFLVMTASSMSGLRWATTQMLLQKESLGLSNPLDTLYHLQPLMALATLPLAIGIEGPKLAVSMQAFRAPSAQIVAKNISVVLFGSAMAFMLGVSEYFLLANTSSITLAIAGIFKELCTILLATVFAGDEMNFLKFGGLTICLSGIALHIYFKTLNSQENKVIMSSANCEEKVKMLSTNHFLNYDSDDD